MMAQSAAPAKGGVLAEPWRLRAPVTTYDAGQVWYPDMSTGDEDASPTHVTWPSSMPEAAAAAAGAVRAASLSTPFRSSRLAPTTTAAQVDVCAELLKRTVSLARPETTSFTTWALDTWLNDAVPLEEGGLDALATTPQSPNRGPPCQPAATPPTFRLVPTPQHTPPAAATATPAAAAAAAPGSLLAMLHTHDAALDQQQLAAVEQLQQHHHHHRRRHAAGTGPPGTAPTPQLSGVPCADISCFQAMPLSAAAATLAASAAVAAARGLALPCTAPFAPQPPAAAGSPLPSSRGSCCGAAPPAAALSKALSDPVGGGGGTMRGCLASSASDLGAASGAALEAASGAPAQAAARFSMQLIQEHHQQHQQALGDGLQLRLGKKQRSVCDLASSSAGAVALSPGGSPFTPSSHQHSFAFAASSVPAPAPPGSPAMLARARASSQGGAAGPLQGPPGQLLPPPAGAADMPLPEVPRQDLQQLRRLWQQKVQKLQQLLDSHRAAAQVGLAAAATEAAAAAAAARSGSSSAGAPMALLLPRSPSGAGAAGGRASRSCGGAVAVGGASVCSTPRCSSSSGVLDLGGATRKRPAAVLDLSQPADPCPPGRSPAASDRGGGVQGPAGAPCGGGAAAAAPSSQPGTPRTPPAAGCGPSLRGARASSAGSASEEAARQLARIQQGVSDLVAFCGVLLTGAPAKWQALLELDVVAGVPAPSRLLRGHWMQLLVQLRLLPAQTQRLESLLRGVRDAHVSALQRCTLQQQEELTRRVLLQVLTPWQAAQLLVGALPGVLDVWEVLVLLAARNSTSRQVTTCC